MSEATVTDASVELDEKMTRKVRQVAHNLLEAVCKGYPENGEGMNDATYAIVCIRKDPGGRSWMGRLAAPGEGSDDTFGLLAASLLVSMTPEVRGAVLATVAGAIEAGDKVVMESKSGVSMHG
ncbi:MAG: hypothetical protein KGJ23_08535 [Euryarchaeota archaeon]|nr:hypothetical protein [Euryarchaeota archaeon]MDE1836649.1 hypothetical protein [Euryarchaeota archaeon]MDE1880322.1 hypothetical protein [Euryarchaeota archaeon]MDE2044619.1 hypothetical protein [Thermoplasmata archaeon]